MPDNVSCHLSSCDDTSSVRKNWLTALFLTFALVLGALQAYIFRNSMGPDGISYIEIGEAWFRKDWGNVVSSHWSPFYSWLLGSANALLRPTASTEFALVHLVNFVTYAVALCCTHYFLTQLVVAMPREEGAKGIGLGRMPLTQFSPRQIKAVGYSVFLLCSLEWIGLWAVTPDMLVFAVVMLVAGLLISIWRNPETKATYALLGLVLALGYLVKAFLFVYSFGVFLMVIWAVHGRVRTPVLAGRMALMLVVFAALSGPQVVAVSMKQGELTFSGVHRSAYEGKIGGGMPIDSSAILLDEPRCYLWEGPVPGSYPRWYDPERWRSSAPADRLQFDLRATMKAAVSNTMTFLRQAHYLLTIVMAFTVVALVHGRIRLGNPLRLSPVWILLFLAAGGIVPYLLLIAHARYIAPFVMLGFMAAWCSIRIPCSAAEEDGVSSRTSQALGGALTLMTCVLLLSVALHAAVPLRTSKAINRDFRGCLAVAQYLKEKVGPNEEDVAVIGNGYGSYWAHLGGFRVIAECSERDFLRASDEGRVKVLAALEGCGAFCVVWPKPPDVELGERWQQVPGTNYYVYFYES